MLRKSNVLLGVAVLAAMLALPILAQETETPAWLQQAACSDKNTTETAAIDQQGDDSVMSIEEAERLFGAHNVCGVLCGYPGQQSCFKLCGDAAGCVNHRCIWF